MLALSRLWRDLGAIAVVLGLLAMVTFLPPDTSLSQVRAAGVLRACVPSSYPPLVTGEADAPGIDVVLLRALADRIGVKLALAPVEGMGRDFNPRHWGISRASCQILAGGVVDSALTRSFLDTGPAYAHTGWALLAPEPPGALEGRRLAVLTNVSGLDRLGLSAWLRARGITARIVPDAPALVAAIKGGDVAGGVTESLLAQALAAANGWQAAPLADGLAGHDLVLGLWKGDLTLKRAIVRAFDGFARDGLIAATLAAYGVQGAGIGSSAQ